jgi:hypothetical protein
MAFSRRLGVVAIVGVSWLVAIGCDDSDDKIPQGSAAGEGGEAPSAGKSSVAGSKNEGGKAGGGSAGKGGASTGGSGGDAGNGGTPSEAGQGGTGANAGMGGETAGASGETNVRGDGGSSGQGGLPPVAASCSFTCANDDDCLIGQNDSQKCNVVSHKCEDPATACTADVDCLVSQSFWFFTCDDDDGCDPDYERCVDAGGKGYCATLPDPDCFGGVPRTFPRFGTAGTIEVCASADPRCRGGACELGCGDETNGCEQGNGDTCSAVTGLCECTQGTECTTSGICGGDGHCKQCANDDDCAATVATTGLGACVEGKCGCANETTCINPGYATATAACQ